MRVLRALERGDALVGDQLSGASHEELEALMGVYAHIGQNLQRAAQAEDDDVSPVIHVFRTTGVLARGALLAFNNHRLEGFWKAWGYDVPADAVTALSLMRDWLIAVLPTSLGPDRSAATSIGEQELVGSAGDHRPPVHTGNAGDDRDRSADDRDERAEAHDVVAAARDERSEARDERAVRRDRGSRGVDLGAGADRAGALRDRRAAAGDRVQAEEDRDAASTDRTLAAEERADASIDEVTGVNTRKEGMVALGRDLDRAMRTKKPFTLAFIDVDNFKGQNASLGHVGGDGLLRHIAELIQADLRSYDLVIRFGGDEFLCGLVDVPIAETANALPSPMTRYWAQHGASFSVGLAELGSGDVLSDLIARADTAMYAAKSDAPAAPL